METVTGIPQRTSFYTLTCTCQTDRFRCLFLSWWRRQMELFSALRAICAENSPITGEFPTQRPVTRSFNFFFDLRLNKRLSKQSWGWWFETQSRPFWRHCNVNWFNSGWLNVWPLLEYNLYGYQISLAIYTLPWILPPLVAFTGARYRYTTSFYSMWPPSVPFHIIKKLVNMQIRIQIF